MATKDRTTKPLTADQKAIVTAVREAQAKGESAARAAFDAASPAAKAAMLRARL